MLNCDFCPNLAVERLEMICGINTLIAVNCLHDTCKERRRVYAGRWQNDVRSNFANTRIKITSLAPEVVLESDLAGYATLRAENTALKERIKELERNGTQES